jgi:hypothetical protein
MARRKKNGYFYAVKMLSKEAMILKKQVCSLLNLKPYVLLYRIIYASGFRVKPLNLKREQVKHVLAEKEIMEKMDHPCLIALAGTRLWLAYTLRTV